MKGVALIAHCETGGDAPFFEARLDAAFSLYRKLGIRYVKTGYAGAARPIGEHLFGQGMVQHYQKVVEKAAQYGLMLDVHEKGRAVVSSGTREEMERDVAAMHSYGLWATLQKDD